MIMRMLREEDLQAVVELMRKCHPARVENPPEWYLAYPTVGAFTEDGILIGYASFTINIVNVAPMLVGMDAGVSPAWRRQGIREALFRERLRYGKVAGAEQWASTIMGGNAAEQRWLENRKMTLVTTIPDAYYDGKDALVYVGPIDGGW